VARLQENVKLVLMRFSLIRQRNVTVAPLVAKLALTLQQPLVLPALMVISMRQVPRLAKNALMCAPLVLLLPFVSLASPFIL
jgi:hypothetical protein